MDLCVNGHLWTPENIYINPRGSRVCIQCKRKAWTDWKKRQQKKLARTREMRYNIGCAP